MARRYQQHSWYWRLMNKHSVRYKRLTDSIMMPVFHVLRDVGFSPYSVTHFRLFVGLLGLAILWKYPIHGGVLFLASLIMDSFDGGLARLMHKSGDRGTFVDRICDYTQYLGSVLVMVIMGHISGVLGMVHTYVVGMAVLLTVLAKQEGQKTDWIINPQSNLVWFQVIWYAGLFLWLFGGVNYLSEIIFWLTVALGVVSIASYMTLMHRWYKGVA